MAVGRVNRPGPFDRESLAARLTEEMSRSELTIGRLARTVGVPTSTLRYYERQGILRPLGRNRHGYRYYDADAVERLRLIRAAQRSGFTLADIASLLKIRGTGARDCQQFTEVAESRLAEVRQALDDLTRLHDTLASALQTCTEDRRCGSSCVVLERFERPLAPDTSGRQ